MTTGINMKVEFSTNYLRTCKSNDPISYLYLYSNSFDATPSPKDLYLGRLFHFMVRVKFSYDRDFLARKLNTLNSGCCADTILY